MQAIQQRHASTNPVSDSVTPSLDTIEAAQTTGSRAKIDSIGLIFILGPTQAQTHYGCHQ
jgi:hypothetical protein